MKRLYVLLTTACLLASCDDKTPKQGDTGNMEEGGVQGGMMEGGDQAGMNSVGGMSAGVIGGNGGNEPIWDMMMPDEGGAGMSLGGQDAGIMQGGMMGGLMLPSMCQEVAQAPEQPMFRLDASCRQGAELLKVRHIRDPRCPEHIVGPTASPGEPVSLSSLVVTGVFGTDKMSVQDQEGGAYSGLWVYSSGRVDFSEIVPGDIVNLEGELIEFFTVTELVLNRDGLEVIGHVNPPTPLLVSDSAKIADGGIWTEQLESMLVEVQAARVTNTAPDCPQDFGMFVINQNLRLDPKYELDLTLGREDFVTRALGIVHFSFEHNKLLIRTEADLELLTCGGLPDKCEASECPVTIDEPESGVLVITEIQSNPRGVDTTREYVELYNPSSTPISITGWRLQDCAGNTANLSGTLDPRTHWVVAQSTNRNENGGVNAQGEMGELILPNGYGSLLLFDAQGALVDQVRYAPGGEEDWPFRSVGESLELIEPASDNRLGASWTAARDSYGDGGDGTPGRAY